MTLAQSRSIRFGINYTPSKRWYYCWNDWNLREIEEDFDAAASLGVDHLRVQLIWPSFQPNPRFVSPGHLARLRELMKAAQDRGLEVLVSVLTGFLSGWSFLPPRVSKRDVFTSAKVFDAEVLLTRRVLEAVRGYDNFMGLDVGNEINCLDHELPPEQGDDWARRYCDAIRGDLAGKPVVNGIDHTPLLRGSTFSLAHLANDYPLTSLHCWPMFTAALEKGPLDHAASLHLSRFFTQFIRLWARDQAKPIWVQEFGACDMWGSPEAQAAYLRQGVDLAVRSGVRLFTWWCTHDKTQEAEFDAWEYHYGLFTPDNRPKPLASVYREVIQQYARPAAGALSPGYNCDLVVPEGFAPRYAQWYPDGQYLQQTLASSTWRLYEVYLEQVAAGRTPELVREAALSRGPRDPRPVVRPDLARLMA